MRSYQIEFVGGGALSRPPTTIKCVSDQLTTADNWLASA